MNKIYIILVMLLFCCFSLFSNTKTDEKHQVPIHEELAETKLVLNASPLTQTELDSKTSIIQRVKDLSVNDTLNAKVYYYHFTDFDKAIALRVLNYLLNNPTISKVTATKSAIALVVKDGFSESEILKNIKNTGLSFNPISAITYFQTNNNLK